MIFILADVTKFSKDELLKYKENLEFKYKEYVNHNLSLDMSRGKPGSTQLDISNSLLGKLENYKSENGLDCRNYGVLDGIPEMKKLFSDLLEIEESKIIVGGNASLNLEYDAIARNFIFGTHGNTPWCKVPNIKFLCPTPGYDRHFAMCEEFNIEMINIDMTEDGPDMDMIEKLVAKDESIKGIFCVPLYSNPDGVCYSDETVKRLASMKTKAKDFRIFWDNAYGVHHFYGDHKVHTLLNILDECEKSNNPDRTYYFFSTSKITFPGAGVSLIASNENNIKEIKKHMNSQTIGFDKLNQLRIVQFFKNAEGIKEHMKKLADDLRPKFDLVLNTLDRELKGTGLATWKIPDGGYFVSIDTLEGCAKDTIELGKIAGVTLTPAGSTFPYKKDPKDSNIRLAPSYPSLEELKIAIELFCICVKLVCVRKLLENL